MTTMRNRIVRKLLCSAAVIAISAITVVLDSNLASADSFWFCGDQCNNNNPATFAAPRPGGSMHCSNDAVTVASTPPLSQNITLQLRYSNKCETIWGRYFGGIADGRHYLITLSRNGSEINTSELISDNQHQNWGLMMNDHNVEIYACIHNQFHNVTFGCTTAF